MSEKPIIFNGEMIRATLDGRKTQTRRVVKPQPEIIEQSPDGPACGNADNRYLCHNGQPGHRLWVRETWAPVMSTGCSYHVMDGPRDDPKQHQIAYRADGDLALNRGCHWKPSIFMPRWASRITLEITDIRVERVREITPTDALAEGVAESPGGMWSATEGQAATSPKAAFALLWNHINAKRGYGWDVNPWVWVVEFRLI